MELVNISDFKRSELKVAKIITVDVVEGADRLWKLQLEVGSESKQIVAGIKLAYPEPSVLLGKSIIIVNNLEPTVIKGTASHGMLLAAKDPVTGTLTLITTDSPVASGSSVG